MSHTLGKLPIPPAWCAASNIFALSMRLTPTTDTAQPESEVLVMASVIFTHEMEVILPQKNWGLTVEKMGKTHDIDVVYRGYWERILGIHCNC